MYTAPATALASLRAGRVDSAFLFEPYDTVARAVLPVKELYEVGKSWPFPCMVVTVPGKLLEEQPDTVRKILMSIRRSIEFMKAKPTEAAKVLAPAFMPEGEIEAEGHNVKPEEVMLKSLKSNKFDWRLSQPDLNRMQELAGIMKGMDILNKDVPISSIVDLRWQKELEKRK
jgi:NitT/TauT family transport system substrate-binding protein